jgi:hypothetical protein
MGIGLNGFQLSYLSCLRIPGYAVRTLLILWRAFRDIKRKVGWMPPSRICRPWPAIVVEYCECFATMCPPMECDRRSRRHGAKQARQSSVSLSYPARRNGILLCTKRARPGLQADDANIPSTDPTLNFPRLDRVTLHSGEGRSLAFLLAFDSTWRITAR